MIHETYKQGAAKCDCKGETNMPQRGKMLNIYTEKMQALANKTRGYKEQDPGIKSFLKKAKPAPAQEILQQKPSHSDRFGETPLLEYLFAGATTLKTHSSSKENKPPQHIHPQKVRGKVVSFIDKKNASGYMQAQFKSENLQNIRKKDMYENFSMEKRSEKMSNTTETMKHMPLGRSDREELLWKISQNDFVVTDLTLFLDTHLRDEEMLQTLQEHRCAAKDLKEKYEETFGPLTARDVEKPRWDWVAGPWPWDKPVK